MNPKLGLLMATSALAVSIATGIYGIVPAYIAVALVIICLPACVLCLGLCLMSKPKKEEEEERKKMPFIGY